MKFGVAMFATDYAVRPDDFARACEERGYHRHSRPHLGADGFDRPHDLARERRRGRARSQRAHPRALALRRPRVPLQTGEAVRGGKLSRRSPVSFGP